MELFVKICLKMKKDIFESLLKLFVKKMSFIISLVVLFVMTPHLTLFSVFDDSQSVVEGVC